MDSDARTAVHGNGTHGQRLLVVIFDCAEKTLVEKWMAEGHLPNLKKLHDRGAYGPLASTADLLVATPGPVAMTSQWPAENGFVCWMQWRPDQQTEQRCDPSWAPWTPFYRRLGPLGKRVIAIDVPMAYEPVPFDGMEIVSWGSYDKLGEVASYPPELYPKLAKKYHKLPMGPELGELSGIRFQLKLKNELIHGTEKAGDACRDLLRDEKWDLFIAGLGATHRAGHNFWDHGSFRETNPPAELVAEYDNALRDVYAAADRQLGKMLSVIPDDVAVVVYATHGMGPSTSRFDLMPELLDRIVHNRKSFPDEGPPPKKSLLKRLRGAIPVSWRSRVKRSLPKGVQDAMTKFWAGASGRDWSQIRAFAPAGDLEGYVRINLKGREREGIVEPAEYEPLMKQIEEGFLSWKDEATGKPIVQRVIRGSDLWPQVPREKRSPSMPDLIVQWADDLPVMRSQAMVSEKYGKLVWPIPDKFPDGRSGHHRPTGWMVAVAEGVEPGTRIEGGRGIDLAPTLMALMGLPPFDDMRGRPIAALAPEHGAERAPAAGVR